MTPGEPWSVTVNLHRRLQSDAPDDKSRRRRKKSPLKGAISGSHWLLTRTASRLVPVAGQVGGDFKREGPERAAMLAESFAVQINIGHQAGRLEPQKISLPDCGAPRSSRAGTSRVRDKKSFPCCALPSPNCAEGKPPASRRR